MNTIAGKRALVTGAGSGIGRAIALALAAEQAHVCIVDIDGPALERVAAEARALSVEVLLQVADVTDQQAVDAVVAAVTGAGGGLDVLVNSAGNLYWGATDRMTPEQCDSVLDVNVQGTVRFTRALLPVLLARDEAHIVNVASTAGLAGAHQRAVYSAAKFGIVGFSESLRMEYRDRGLGVSVLCPGFVSGTALFRGLMTESGTRSAAPPSWDEKFTPAEAIGRRAIDAILASSEGIVIQTRGERWLWRTKRLSPVLLEWLHRRLIGAKVVGFVAPPLSRIDPSS